MSGPVVWVAELHEAPVVAGLLVEFRDWNGGDWPSANAFLASVERIIERGEGEFLLGSVDRDSRAAAICQLRYRFSVWVAAEDCWLEDLFVAETARGHGLGRAVVSAALERAAERGARRIELDTKEWNEPARGLYESLGFSNSSKGGGGRDLFYGRRLESRGS
ncbi:MAG TPA: GNAT family N-acetyltransferase [Solirubrobacteraceae bacterium]|jgi:GNAT superfamily N-acetyltransferase|nr:GNAT family N-acetyltransferase [Solirubrobacteraceae bacterium]